ncbi:MAG TPA: LamG domain-containing protein, partial [Candidatus Rifleibacterium sp.]|nr:LamG domain-containing protein [Candidatus Rifleibacterium sp.]
AGNSGTGGANGAVDSPEWQNAGGKTGGALKFNGTTTRITIPRSGTAAVNDFTIACWVKTTDSGSGIEQYNAAPILNAEGTPSQNDFSFGIDSGGKLTYGDGNGSSDKNTRTYKTVNDGNWHHVAVTRTKADGTVKLYVDGIIERIDTCNSGNSLDHKTDIYVGWAEHKSSGSKYLNGQIDDIRIYNQVLADDKIKLCMSLYGQGISRTLPDLPGIRQLHNLVWHKGKVYRVGGKDASSALSSIDIFDFAGNAWTSKALTDVASSPLQLQRERAAACSFGDEIFMFGGSKTNAVAWNPEVGTVRDLGVMPTNGRYAKTAVACGSSIYLIGGADNETAGGVTSIWKYTP